MDLSGSRPFGSNLRLQYWVARASSSPAPAYHCISLSLDAMNVKAYGDRCRMVIHVTAARGIVRQSLANAEKLEIAAWYAAVDVWHLHSGVRSATDRPGNDQND